MVTCGLTDDRSSELVEFDGRCKRLTHDKPHLINEDATRNQSTGSNSINYRG